MSVYGKQSKKARGLYRRCMDSTEPAIDEPHIESPFETGEASPETEHVSVGLVLSAGGAAADAWHAGVVGALQAAAGWDARSAELILGTSAGSIVGLCLRAGVPPADLCAQKRGQPISEEGQALFDRVVTPYSEARRERNWTGLRPQSPTLTAAALWPPWQTRPLHALVGLLPAGVRATEALRQRMAELHPEPWPTAPLWVPAVRLSDGKRVVFGRDDLLATAAQAVQASCAVPAQVEPVIIAGQRYIDGGLHSYTNADLLGPPAFDLVVVSSAMSGAAGWSKVGGAVSEAWQRARAGVSQSNVEQSNLSDFQPEAPSGSQQRKWWTESLGLAWDDGRAMRAARRQWVDDKLRSELNELRRRGTQVLVVEPDAQAVELADMGLVSNESSKDSVSGDSGSEGSEANGVSEANSVSEVRGRDRGAVWRSQLTDAADRTVRSLLTGHHNRRSVELLRRASNRATNQANN